MQVVIEINPRRLYVDEGGKPYEGKVIVQTSEEFPSRYVFHQRGENISFSWNGETCAYFQGTYEEVKKNCYETLEKLKAFLLDWEKNFPYPRKRMEYRWEGTEFVEVTKRQAGLKEE